MGADLCGIQNMPPTSRPAASDLYRDESDDRLPLHIAGPIVIALSLSLWAGIGFLVSALL
jgi:hypothetical protein